MADKDDEMREQIRGMSNDALFLLLIRRPASYSKEALDEARAELDRRLGPEASAQMEEEYGENGSDDESLDNDSEAETEQEVSLDDEEEPLEDMVPLTRSRTIREQVILSEWYTLIRNGAGNSIKLRDMILQNMLAVKLQTKCRWGVVEVKSQGIIGRVRREFLVIEHHHFSDIHEYIGVRDFCTYLDCCKICVVEPGLFKRFVSKKLLGDQNLISAPKNILAHHDLNTWDSAVEDVLVQTVDEFIESAGLAKSSVTRSSGGILSIW